MKRFIPRLLGLSVVVVALSGFTAASAFASDLVDGSVSAAGDTCSWTNGATTANPPSALTIEANTINSPGGNLSCTGGASATLNNNPDVTFGAGTATADTLNVTVNVDGLSCGYQVENYVLDESGTSSTYSGSATASKTSGSFLCPSTESTTTSVTFH